MQVIFIVTEYKISRLPAFFSGFSLGSIFAEKIEFSLTAGVAKIKNMNYRIIKNMNYRSSKFHKLPFNLRKNLKM